MPEADPPLAENPKQILISKFKFPKLFCFEHLNFGHLRLFRASNFACLCRSGFAQAGAWDL